MEKSKLKRNIIIVIVELIIVALFVGFIVTTYPKDYSLLPDYEQGYEILADDNVDWYKEICSTMRDKDDRTDKENISQEYILSNVTSFLGMDFINIRIFSDQTGEMTRKFQNEKSVFEKGIKYNEKIALTQEQTSEIIKIIEENEFWNIPSHHPDEKLGCDGNTIFIEGTAGNKYNMISMWSPDNTYGIYKIYKSVINCAQNWGLSTDYYYLSYGIPKEGFNQDMY